MTLLFCGIGCGSAPHEPVSTGPAPEDQPPQASDVEGTEEPGTDVDFVTGEVRSLPASATFGALAQAARTLDDRHQDSSESECVIREPSPAEGRTHWRLEADVAAAVRPFPDAPDDLDEHLGGTSGSVRVLTRFGPVGADNPELGLAAFTAARTPTANAAIVVLTDRGVYLRSSSSPVESSQASVFAVDALEQRLSAASSRSFTGVFVTAEAAVPLTTLASALRAIPIELQPSTALAVALPENTRLPRMTSPSSTSPVTNSDLCENGLPSPERGSREGRLGASEMRTTIQSASDAIGRCIETNPTPRFEPSVLETALRVGPEGRVQTACATADAANDATLRACVLGVLRALTFDAPSPRGFVDVAFPLVLEPRAPSHARLLCD